MILSDRSIREDIESGRIQITPLGENAIRPASLDLRLGTELRVADTNADGGWRIHDLKVSPYRIYPGVFVLGSTLEHVTLPDDLVGTLAGKSSRAREGLIVESAGFVDPGWSGELTLEIATLRPTGNLLMIGEQICQIHFSPLSSRAESPYGSDATSHYQFSRGPVPSWERRG